MYLFIACLDPRRIEVVSPKIALVAISSMVLATVETLQSMQAWLSKSHGQGRWVSLGATLAAPCESTVVFFLVRLQTYQAPLLGGTAHVGGVSPLPAPLTQGRPGVSPGSPEWTHKLAKLN